MIFTRYKNSIQIFLMGLIFILAFNIVKLNVNASFEQPKENPNVNIDFGNSSFEEPNLEVVFTEGGPFTSLAQVLANRHNFVLTHYLGGWQTKPVDPADNANPWAYHIEIQMDGCGDIYAPDGKQWAELNADVPGTLYQICDTMPKQKVYYQFYHRGKRGTDVMKFFLREPGNETDPEIDICTTGTAWQKYTGVYVVPDGQTQTEFAFESISSANGTLNIGNLLDDIKLFYPAFLEVSKTAENVRSDDEGEYVLSGDEFTYRMEIKNTGETDSSRTVLQDKLPEGVAYIDNSMTMVYIDIDDSQSEINITADMIDYDEVLNKLTVNIGKLLSGETMYDKNSDTELTNIYANGTRSIKHSESVILTFQVRVAEDDFTPGDLLQNQAKVFYNDLGFEIHNIPGGNTEPEDEYNVSNVVELVYRDRVDLAIEKILAEESKENETFLFRIDYQQTAASPVSRTYYGTVTANSGSLDTMLSFEGLLPGIYTVHELQSNWRYQITDPGDISRTVLINGIDKLSDTVRYENQSKESSAISGKSSIVNNFKGI